MNDRRKFPVLLLVRVTVERGAEITDGLGGKRERRCRQTMLGFTVELDLGRARAPLPDTPVIVTGKVPTATWLWPKIVKLDAEPTMAVAGPNVQLALPGSPETRKRDRVRIIATAAGLQGQLVLAPRSPVRSDSELIDGLIEKVDSRST